MVEIERIKTYIRGLDDHIEGGIPRGSVSMICGTPGSMKSSMAYSILYNNAKEEGLKSLYITLEQDINSLKQQTEKLQMKHGDVEKDLEIVDYNIIEDRLKEMKWIKDTKLETDWMKKIVDYILDIKDEHGYDLIVIDSLDALYSLASIEAPRREIYYFFKRLREADITCLLISEMLQDGRTFSHHGVEDFLSDGIIHLEFQKRGDILASLERYIGTVKMRSTDHDTQYFPILYTGGKFTVFGREDLELE